MFSQHITIAAHCGNDVKMDSTSATEERRKIMRRCDVLGSMCGSESSACSVATNSSADSYSDSAYSNVDLKLFHKDKLILSLRRELSEAVALAEKNALTARALATELDMLKVSTQELQEENNELVNDMQDVIFECEEMREKYEETVEENQELKLKYDDVQKETELLEERFENQRDGRLAPEEVAELMEQAKEQMNEKLRKCEQDAKSLEGKCSKVEQSNFELKGLSDLLSLKITEKDTQLTEMSRVVTELRLVGAQLVKKLDHCTCSSGQSPVLIRQPCASEELRRTRSVSLKQENNGLWDSFSSKFTRSRSWSSPKPTAALAVSQNRGGVA